MGVISHLPSLRKQTTNTPEKRNLDKKATIE